MRLFLAIALFLFALLPVNAAETLIKQRLNTTLNLSPTKYSSNPVITASKELQKLKTLGVEDKNAIIKTFNAINAFLGSDSICKGGSFAINPAYYYKDGKKIQEGFETNFTLNCVFVESQKQEFNAILDKIQAEVSKNTFLMFPIPRVDLGVDEKVFSESDSVLNAKLLNLALQKAKEYSNLTQKKCSIKEITLGDEGSFDKTPLKAEAQLMRATAKNSLEDIALPSARESQKSLWGDVIFSCK
ncbi:hypothetical protein LS70_000050 [Helicobacter sp. MIT 11-5569]|uniref:hypothetical protein n=1 Tax=Helicobacter sp. MIT 11-5569 TaxID=1548151 RepID=UPI0010FD8CDA|nr:hypothetical protein [Helicobacter sp. MIT 11-5569]TLD84995.1 hypothetical protein LS70_000050 [Helicobacter sp. MIT 11-5569]